MANQAYLDLENKLRSYIMGIMDPFDLSLQKMQAELKQLDANQQMNQEYITRIDEKIQGKIGENKMTIYTKSIQSKYLYLVFSMYSIVQP